MKIQAGILTGTMEAKRYSKWELDSKKGQIVLNAYS